LYTGCPYLPVKFHRQAGYSWLYIIEQIVRSSDCWDQQNVYFITSRGWSGERNWRGI